MTFDTALVWIFLGIFALLLVGMLLSQRSQHRRDVVMLRFSEEVGLAAGDDAMVAAVRRRVASVTRARLLGSLMGLVIGAALFLLNLSSASGLTIMFLIFPLLIIGLTLGAVIVTLRDSLFPQHPDAPRVARATTPTIADYVPPRRRATARVLLAVALIVTVLGSVLSLAGALDGGVLLSSAVLPLLAVATLSTGAAEWLSRRVVDRPQPASSSLELSWDDALRADTLLNLTQLTSFLNWIAVAAAVQGILVGVDASAGTNWSTGLGTQLPTWGVLVLTFEQILVRPKRHFLRRLWPELAAEVDNPRAVEAGA